MTSILSRLQITMIVGATLGLTAAIFVIDTAHEQQQIDKLVQQSIPTYSPGEPSNLCISQYERYVYAKQTHATITFPPSADCMQKMYDHSAIR